MHLICGIYKIVNLINEKRYVGSSVDIIGRFFHHQCNLRHNHHPNKHLQNAWNKYGENNFDFIIIEECLESNLLERESYWMDQENVFDDDCGYNILSIARRHKGRREHHTQFHKEKITKGLIKFYEENGGSTKKGKIYPNVHIFHNEVTRKKISDAVKESYKTHKSAFFGKHLPNDVKKKISEKNKEWAKTHKNSFKGKRHTDQSRKKMSESHKGKPVSEENKRKTSERMRGSGHPLYGKIGKDNPKYILIDDAISNQIVAKYQSGYTIAELMREYNFKRPIIRRTLDEKGIEIVGRNQNTNKAISIVQSKAKISTLDFYL
jgi:group I intron endonuclease